jgi:protein-S-isoprenylcysteine O-methyltransferase Ste14
MDNTSIVLIIYFMVIASYGIAEMTLQLWFSKWKFKKTRDKGLILIMVPFYLVIYLAPVENIIFKNKLYVVLITIGFLILILGVSLRIISLLKLRENFSVIVESGDKNSLIVDGIYKHVRHPLYLATLLIALAGCVIFACIIAWIFFVLTLASILRRIKIEETFLISRFPEYPDYMKKTYKLIPFVY